LKILGRSFSGWWLLLCLPCGVLLMPVAFGLSNAVGALVFGPPPIWDRPITTPPRDALIGTYQQYKSNWSASKEEIAATLELHSDGSMIVHALPVSLGWDENSQRDRICMLSGHGGWSAPDELNQVRLSVSSDGGSGACHSGSYDGLQVAGHSWSYRLYWAYGDPDSGEGAWLKRW
jgi:hypothetical protein